MELVFLDSHGLILVLWGIIWMLSGTGLVVVLVMGFNAEDRAVAEWEAVITIPQSTEREIARVA
jgi:hypothetical protein